MSTTEVIASLEEHWCQNITPFLDPLSLGTESISSGDFGNLYRGALTDDRQVVIKAINIPVKSNDQRTLKNAARGILSLSTHGHPNVLHLLGLVEFRDQIGMVYDWMEHGSLPGYLEQHPEVDRYQMSTGICDGLWYLHAEGIVHGDLKGVHVLIDRKGTPKLTKFGKSILLKLTETTSTSNLSPRWTAPELMEGHGADTFAADVYSLGMTILETMTGKVPYFGITELEVAEEKGLPLRPEDSIPSNNEAGNKLWELLMSCWVHEPEKRPRAKHVWDTMKTIVAERLAVSQAEGTEG